VVSEVVLGVTRVLLQLQRVNGLVEGCARHVEKGGVAVPLTLNGRVVKLCSLLLHAGHVVRLALVNGDVWTPGRHVVLLLRSEEAPYVTYR